jgi:hypothetical protein
MKSTLISLIAGFILWCTGGLAFAQEIDWDHFDPKTATPQEMQRVIDFLDRMADQYPGKVNGNPSEIKSLIINGNKITTIVYNYGNITRPNTLGNVADLVWNRLGYGFEFTPLVAAEVVDVNGDTQHILDDGMWLPNQGGYAPDGSIKWGWLPKPGFADPNQLDIAAWSHRRDVGGDLTRKPHSWPESFYNNSLGRYVWPAFLGNDATSPDEEVYFVCDDYTNAKYQYYPFPDDQSKRGLGLDLECRFFQFNNPLAEDIIFLVYRVTNRSPRTINKVYFGMYGDPHVGGPSDFGDDLAFFIPPTGPLADPYPQRARNMVYAWDPDGVGQGGLPTGYFGFKFLESPSNSVDGKDNDDDGIVDESPFNDAGFFIDGSSFPLTTGIVDTAKYTRLYGPPKPRWSGDEDGDWSLERDDVGIDGIPGTGDTGEGNGKPDIGLDANGNLVSEPSFGIRDVDESDQIGLTSFNALGYTNTLPNVPKNDVLFWQLLSADSIAINQTLFTQPGDNVFVYGSGPFTLAPGATQRFSIALLMGTDLQDLILNAETAQRVLEANYRFAQPPPKPNVTAVPGNGFVTLYWDDVAEKSTDPLTGVNDFEGYKVYRSEDFTFSDVFTITDANGTPFLGRPLQQFGVPAQFDLVNQWSGLHPVEYLGRGVKYNLGSNTGLAHMYRDFTVQNGKTYYYAVASYDHGFDSLGVQLAPTESQISIIQDPITKVFTFDQNTVAVTPGPLPSGSILPGEISIAEQVSGAATGGVAFQVLNPPSVLDNMQYDVAFDTLDGSITYNVQPLQEFSEVIEARDTLFVPLQKANLISGTVTVRNASGAVVDPGSYFVDLEQGRIRGTTPGSLPAGQNVTISYNYFTVFQSTLVNAEDGNPVFDGLRVYAQNEPLALDSLGSGWITKNNTNLIAVVHKPFALVQTFVPVPRDFEIRWNDTDTTATGKWAHPGDTLLTNNGRQIAVCPFKIVNVTDNEPFRALVNGAVGDSLWRPGREVIILTPSGAIQTNASVTFFGPPPGEPLILPAAGNVFIIKNKKPFRPDDRFRFTSTAVRYDASLAERMLDDIYVVPNPYVAYSNLETPGVEGTKRGDSRLQFRNLPTRCTIRIYTMVGELVDTIDKNDNTSIVDWDILSNEGQRLAYGVYIFHVDAPGVGEKIGRFALIK